MTKRRSPPNPTGRPQKRKKVHPLDEPIEFELCNFGAVLLAERIIERAVYDYLWFVQRGKDSRYSSSMARVETKDALERFFRSRWFAILTMQDKITFDACQIIRERYESGE